MKLHLRFVDIEDARILFDWRLDPDTRKASKQTDEFSFDSHLNWLKGSLSNCRRHIFMAVNEEGQELGTVRFDRNEDRSALIGVTVSPSFRGRGVGTEILKRACDFFWGNWDCQLITAEIKPDNTGSIKAFERAGFVLSKQLDRLLTYELTRP